MISLKSENLFGVKITTDSEENILKYILSYIENGDSTLKIYTPNPEMIMLARKNPEFKHILNEADINLPDGVGLLVASRLLGFSLKTRIAGVDLMERICQMLSDENLEKSQGSKNAYSVGFFGGRGNVAKSTAECLQKKYSGLQISYIGEQWDEAKVKGNRISVLFVAMGFPKQEIWISEKKTLKNVQVAMGVGGAFDFISGKVMRAPKILRTIGLEWLFRLMIQPWRIRRQLQLVTFTVLVFFEFFQVRIFGKKE